MQCSTFAAFSDRPKDVWEALLFLSSFLSPLFLLCSCFRGSHCVCVCALRELKPVDHAKMFAEGHYAEFQKSFFIMPKACQGLSPEEVKALRYAFAPKAVRVRTAAMFVAGVCRLRLPGLGALPAALEGAGGRCCTGRALRLHRLHRGNDSWSNTGDPSQDAPTQTAHTTPETGGGDYACA